MSKAGRICLRVFTLVLALVLAASVTLHFTGTEWFDSLFSAPAETGGEPVERPVVNTNTLSAAQKHGANAQSGTQSATQPVTLANPLPTAKSMDDLLGIFESMGVMRGSDWRYSSFTTGLNEAGGEVYTTFTDEMADAAMPSAPAMPTPAPALTGKDTDGGYSQTNSQVQGVEEGDRVKTDGKYIYHLTYEGLRIYSVNGADIELLSNTPVSPDNMGYSGDMYVSGDRLIMVSNRWNPETTFFDIVPSADDNAARTPLAGDYAVATGYREFTVYEVYDISDRTKPALARSFSLDGYSVQTRLMGDHLYFVANKWVYSIPEEYQPCDVLPMYRDTGVSGDFNTIPPEDVYCFPNPDQSSYLMVGSMNINDDSPVTFDSYVGGGHNIYMSAGSMYVIRSLWNEKEQTGIYRFAVDGGQITYAAEGLVDGSVLNQYSMDEHGGVFRIATTVWGEGNYVTTLDSGLRLLGRTQPLAPDETIHSVRFMGDMAYVVTYRQTDPLFSIDLSDPASPVVLGALKIPGFSQYLHPVGENLLIGFGRNTVETFVRRSDGREEPLGVMDDGLKISLFDISDPTDVREIDVLLLGTNWWAEAFTNPRSMMVDASRAQFGFTLEGPDERTGEYTGKYRIIAVENGRLVDKWSVTSALNKASKRMAYIGNTLYTVDSMGVTAYNYTTFERLGEFSMTVGEPPIPAKR